MSKLSLYLHIPFCNFMCHYCDFAKTANWEKEHLQKYIVFLEQHIKVWLEYLLKKGPFEFNTVFFGGGTPSLLSNEYKPIFKILSPFLANSCEITLETNPEDIHERNLQSWKKLGFNRLSIGVQTLSSKGLNILTRQHDNKKTLENLKLSTSYFNNVSCDLIYGWPSQKPSELMTDLEQVTETAITHLSLYNLTYENKTPIGRAQQRGKIKETSDIILEKFYLKSQKFLKKKNFDQYELANWSKPTFESQHNKSYWENRYYLAIGSGSHGYLPLSENRIGFRYHYNKNPKNFSKHPFDLNTLKDSLLSSTKKNSLIQIEERSQEQWLIEYISSSIRTKNGIYLNLIEKTVGKKFKKTKIIQEAIQQQQIAIINKIIKLSPKEWFRENSWTIYILECF